MAGAVGGLSRPAAASGQVSVEEGERRRLGIPRGLDVEGRFVIEGVCSAWMELDLERTSHVA